MNKKKIVVLPTSEQEAWLRENYKLYNRYHLRKHLSIDDKLLTKWFHHLGLNKRNGQQITLTKEQKQFVRDHYLADSQEQIAVKLCVAVTTVQRYCNRTGLKKLKYPEPPLPKQIISFAPPEKPQRPRADHTNISQEQRIEQWLAVPVKTSKRAMVKIKHLNDDQMLYIMQNFEHKTAQQLAEYLKIEKFMVKLFCQTNNIEPYVIPKKKKPKDDYHYIPHERKLRMQKVGYNPEKKTA